jgi:hypothetical protein
MLKFFKKDDEICRTSFREVENHTKHFGWKPSRVATIWEASASMWYVLQIQLRGIWLKVQSGLKRLGMESNDGFLSGCSEPSASIKSGNFFTS